MAYDFQQYEGRVVLILGATGFIGCWVARLLSNSKAELVLCVRDVSAAEELFARYGIAGRIFQIDLADETQVRKSLNEIRPDILFNLAVYGVARSEQDPKIAHQINVELVEVLCQELARSPKSNWDGRRLIHAGTAMEYGQIPGDLREDSAGNPTTLYGISKLAGTQTVMSICRASGLAGCTARLFAVYGPGEAPERLLPSLLKIKANPELLPMTAGLHKRDFVYVEDAAEALIRLGISSATPGEIVNVATGRLTSIRRFAELAADTMDIPREYLGFGILPTRVEEMAHLPEQSAITRADGVVAENKHSGRRHEDA